MRVVVMLSAISLAGCGLAPLRFIDARADSAAADSADDGSAEGSVDATTDGAMDGATDDSRAEDVVAQTDSSADGGSQMGPAGTPLGLCTGARAIGSTALGVRPSLPWSNTTLTGQRTVFQGHIEAGWTDPRVVVVDNSTDTVVYSERLPSAAGRIDHNPADSVRFANGSYRWMLCAVDAGSQLRHSAEWRFRVQGTVASSDGRAGMIPLVSDATGDGFSELIVGAPNAMSGGSRRGVVRAWSYGASGVVSGAQASTVATGSTDDAQTGFNVVLLGDVNGDGRADLAVASPGEANGSMLLAGAVRVFTGSANRAAPFVLATTLRGAVVNEGFGDVVAALGDVNGDGLDDFAIGSPALASDQGRVRVYVGDRMNTATISQSIDGAAPSDAFGWSIAGIGDLNGDGLNDVAISALRGDVSVMDAGSVSVWLGQRTGPRAIAVEQRFGPPLSAMMASDYGYAVAAAGDVNHDGYADMLVGSPNEGRVYVLRSTGTAIDVSAPHHTFEGPSVGRFGRALLGAVDINGDHHADVVIGEPRAAAGDGAAHLHFSGADGAFFDSRTIRGAVGAQSSTGLSLGVVGDIFWGRAQSAGCPTLLVGAPGNIALSDPGRVIAVHGDPLVGLDNEPGQREITSMMSDVSFGSSVGGPRAR